jgi:hypothetical protein
MHRSPRIFDQQWSPYSLGTNLIAWWSADATSTIVLDGSNRVDMWTDLIKGIVLRAPGSVNRPPYGATDFNGSPCVIFNDPLHYLDSGGPAPLPTGSDPSEMWCLVDQMATPAIATFTTILSVGSGLDTMLRNMVTRAGATFTNGRVGAGGSVATSPDNFEGRKYMRGEYMPTSIAVTVNSGFRASSSATVTSNADLVTMGRLEGGSNRMRGSIRDILVTRSLSDQSAIDMAEWLNKRRNP